MSDDGINIRRGGLLIASGKVPTIDLYEISVRLHDILRNALQIHMPGPDVTLEAGIGGVDEVKEGILTLRANSGDQNPPRLASNVRPARWPFRKGGSTVPKC